VNLISREKFFGTWRYDRRLDPGLRVEIPHEKGPGSTVVIIYGDGGREFPDGLPASLGEIEALKAIGVLK